MRDVANLAARAVERNGQQAGARSASPLVRKLFVMLHGAYGNQFAAKFATGKANEGGEDLGTRAAMLVWDSALSRFAGDVVEIAARRLVKDNPKFPFNLGELQVACEAATPRQTYDQEMGLIRLPAPEVKPIEVSFTLRKDGKDWARRLMARVEAGDKSVHRNSLKLAREAMGVCA